MTGDEEFVVWPHRPRLALAFGGSVALVAIAAATILRLGPSAFETLVKAVMACCAAFFALCAFFVGFRLLRPRPALILRRDGVVDRATLASVGFILWEELGPPELVFVYGQPFLCMRPANPLAARARVRTLPPGKRWWVARNLRWGLVAVPGSVVGDLVGLKARIEAFRATHSP